MFTFSCQTSSRPIRINQFDTPKSIEKHNCSKMPRYLQQRNYILKMKKTIAMWKRYFAIVYLMKWEEDDMDTDILLYLIHACDVAIQSCYLYRSALNGMKPCRWEFLLKNTIMVNDTEFLHEFRISRQCLYSLLHLLQTHNPQSADFKVVECVHVLTLLKFLGSYGNAATFTSIVSSLGIGYGSVANYIERAMTAVLSLKKEVIVWPNEEERKLISQGFFSVYSFANCIGMELYFLWSLSLLSMVKTTSIERVGMEYIACYFATTTPESDT
jgi:hypothetical protein